MSTENIGLPPKNKHGQEKAMKDLRKTPEWQGFVQQTPYLTDSQKAQALRGQSINPWSGNVPGMGGDPVARMQAFLQEQGQLFGGFGTGMAGLPEAKQAKNPWSEKEKNGQVWKALETGRPFSPKALPNTVRFYNPSTGSVLPLAGAAQPGGVVTSEWQAAFETALTLKPFGSQLAALLADRNYTTVIIFDDSIQYTFSLPSAHKASESTSRFILDDAKLQAILPASLPANAYERVRFANELAAFNGMDLTKVGANYGLIMLKPSQEKENSFPTQFGYMVYLILHEFLAHQAYRYSKSDPINYSHSNDNEAWSLEGGQEVWLREICYKL